MALLNSIKGLRILPLVYISLLLSFQLDGVQCHEGHSHSDRKRSEINHKAEGLYFYVSVYNPRCFYEELPGETIVKGSYEHPHASTKSIDIILTSPNGVILLNKKAEEKGRFAHHALEAGMHKICIVPAKDSKPWPSHDSTAKFRLVIEVQAKETQLSADIARKNHVTHLEEAVMEMENKIELLLKNLDYNSQQEKHFRDQSERINSRIIFWSLVQTTLLLVSGIWQIIHLKGF
eukprot:CAMPEP_0204887886 /NCGR_PEP_ID=MMETSP1349-20130617/19071_1 /ASSEMBLY_ACC=CAM_ASM_000710 /TAXON_ID=215587 /ORGANISM="Aplanochytrium stocchinoi, Strain GSBS06" /LENGTH=233 /DNA_ID=CAMNT_0052050979 /DNA_START=72 /DNA_END=770 /DNA_ORIENTATION=-